MQKAKIEIEIIRTDSGKMRIKFSDGGNYLVPDTMENIGLNAALEVELEHITGLELEQAAKNLAAERTPERKALNEELSKKYKKEK